jgi:hypothetical protein
VFKKNKNIFFILVGVVLFFLGVLSFFRWQHIENSAYLISISIMLFIRYFIDMDYIERFSKKLPKLYFLFWLIYILIFSVILPQLLIEYLKG